MDNNQKIVELVAKLNSGNISSNEYQELLSWYNSFDDTILIIDSEQESSSHLLKEKMLTRIKEKTYTGREHKQELLGRRKSSFQRIKWVASTAVAATLIMTIGLWLYNKEKKATVYSTNPQQIEKLIPPGSNKAQLILSGGKKIDLEDKAGGIIIDEDITYSSGEQIVDLDKNQTISIQVPRAGTYQVTLSDGSQVWLNSGSKLTYPVNFKGEVRQVKLEGEAYFKIKKMLTQRGTRVPFSVHSSRQNIQVLGTEFNISDYPEFNYSHTTLHEGKVSIDDAVILQPKQQYLLQGNQSVIKEVNTESYTAWREGKFDFDDKSLVEILDEISLWYDIKVIYEKKVPQVDLSGQAYRDNNFNIILRLLDVAKVDYKLDITKRELIIK